MTLHLGAIGQQNSQGTQVGTFSCENREASFLVPDSTTASQYGNTEMLGISPWHTSNEAVMFTGSYALGL